VPTGALGREAAATDDAPEACWLSPRGTPCGTSQDALRTGLLVLTVWLVTVPRRAVARQQVAVSPLVPAS